MAKKVKKNQKVETNEVVEQVEKQVVKPAEEQVEISDELFKAALKKKAKRLVRDTAIFTGGVLIGALALAVIKSGHKDEEVTESNDSDVIDVDFEEE